MRIRRPVGIVLLNSPAGLVLYDSGTLKQWDGEIIATESIASLLTYCNKWLDKNLVIRYLTLLINCDEDTAKKIIMELLDAGILIQENQSLQKHFETQEVIWRNYGWEDPFLFHLHTNQLPKMDYKTDPKGFEDKALMEKYLKIEKLPDNYKEMNTRIQIYLPKNPQVKQQKLTEVFTDWVGSARYSGPLSLDEFSWITYLGYGQTANRRLPITGNHVAKTSPSGGSRHPTEVYPIVLSVDGLIPGLYHYNVKNHSLELLRENFYEEFVKKHIITHPSRPAFKPTVVYLYTTIFERSMYRYREPRSYRVMNYDLGHLMQTTAYLASAINRSSYRGYSLHDSILDDFLDIDGIYESVMSFTIIG
ncbi:SagB/ThcOx family dehydrogenase [Bacillus sp. IBL03825]|uniref:SagB/ThcOx family dehydrogenase n=1 Tax=Bacillus sp. IBL03825 TaxID=2953580 RepID=UPI00215792F5|nr:SagB/ThcOx family dehydrogenase [Bacillus sp. IBL03825]MCR6850385.1 SagB/ThcOx family dehydrogenase [Bacillus sp. IBL03825]